jgi:hypothetical protein
LDPLSEEDHIIVDDDVNLDDDDDEDDEIIELQPHSRGSQGGTSKH